MTAIDNLKVNIRVEGIPQVRELLQAQFDERMRMRNLLAEAGELLVAYARQKTLDDVEDMDAYAENVYAAICKMLNQGIESDTQITQGD